MLCRLSLHRLGVRSDMFLPQARPANPLHTTFQCPKRQALLSMFVNWLPLMNVVAPALSRQDVRARARPQQEHDMELSGIA